MVCVWFECRDNDGFWNGLVVDLVGFDPIEGPGIAWEK